MKKIIFLLLVFVFVSCIDNDGSISEKELKTFKENVVSKGDIYSFSMVSLYYDGKNNYYEVLPYSIIMANKFNNANGCKEVYFDIIRINNNGKFGESLILKLNE